MAAAGAAANHPLLILQHTDRCVLQCALTLTLGDPAALEPCRRFALGFATAASAARLLAPLARFGLQAEDSNVSCLAAWARMAPMGVHCQRCQCTLPASGDLTAGLPQDSRPQLC